ncbi:Histidine kinase [Catalinimonas alkaloidigena]|uniref:Histidine kinase n=1 Tax=Catalinimonas alkaloidigena TaxID=1075417 RepID=A0A1G9SFQ5_9BACT|nr:sensor histidine kinase [Catalinimonas alkaloidigena]SDM33615.1 Histidine kinase [Catalinimonas alkaloidigena]
MVRWRWFWVGYLMPLALAAQLPAISFETITTEDGLPSNLVLSATKDHQGFMWFGTRRCPVRYDGNTFRPFLEPETELVSGLAEDSSGRLWVSTDLNGVCTIDPITLQLRPVPSAQPTPAPQTGHFFRASDGYGWYGDWYGANRINLTTAEVRHYPFRPTNYVMVKASFLEDREGTVWVLGADNGLFRYDRAADTLVCVLGRDCPDTTRRLETVFTQGCVDRAGQLWIGTQRGGLLRYDPHTDDYELFPTDPAVLSVAEGEDENGRPLLWVGDDEGLSVFRPEQGQFYRFPDLFPDAYSVNALYRDTTEGIVWACTSEGILKYHPRSNLIQTIRLPEGLVDMPVTVTTIVQDQADADVYWLGLSHTGMVRWHRPSNQFSLVRFPPAGTAPETRWIAQRDDGTLWIGVNQWHYNGPGLLVYDPACATFLETPLSRLANRYFSVAFFMYGFFDPQQRLWIGNSDEGIHVLAETADGEAQEVTPWSQAQQQELLQHNNLINDLLLDRRGGVWLATYNGIYLADEARRRFTLFDSVGGDYPTVNTLLEDQKGHLWAARWGAITETDTNGRRLSQLTTAGGLQDRENRGLVEDRYGHLWIGNYEGLHAYRTDTKRLFHFSVGDGLLSNNTMDRLFTNRAGDALLIGQKNGFNVLRVDLLRQPYPAPPLAVSSLRVQEQERPFLGSTPIHLKRSENAFSVDFVALNYPKLPTNQYAYYLEGLETDWKYSGPQHLASYTNLSPGPYTLHLKAADAFGNWNDQTLQLHFRVAPAFYETWTFRLLVVVAVLGLLYSLYRYRINQLLRLQQVRNRISADLHDEIGASLSGISIMGTMARQHLPTPHPSVTFLERIVDDARQLSTSLDDIVWSVKPENDALAHLIARMTRYASELLEAKGIDYHVQVPEQVDHLTLSMEQRRDFYLIFKEALNNLVKHAQCSYARIEIRVDRQSLHLAIQDNGIGFDLNAPSEKARERNGLGNLYQRAQQLNGTLRIDSAVGEGTRIALTFPV